MSASTLSDPGPDGPMRPVALLLGLRVLWTLSVQMLLMAIAWHAYEITGRAWTLALIGLAQFLPVLLFSIPAGYLADRFDRRLVIGLSLWVQALTAAGLAWLAVEGSLGTGGLYGACLLIGVARATQQPALQAIVPALVPPHRLARTMAMVSTASQVSVIMGPALGGFLMVAGGHWVYALSALLFTLSLLMPLGMRPLESMVVPRKLSWTVLLAGLRFIGGRPVVMGAILLDLLAVLFGGAVALLPIFVKEILHGNAADLGLLRSAPAAGALLMSLLLVWRPIERRVGTKLLVAVALFGISTMVFGFARSFWLSAAALAVNGAADMVSVVIRQTLVQLETPDDMRGRVSAVNSVFIGASNQLGEFQAGLSATLMGPVAAIVLGGAVTASLPWWWRRFFPDLAARQRMVAGP